MASTFEAWRDPSDGSVAFAPRREIHQLRTKGLLSPDAVRLYAVEAATYEEAMAVHHLRMGWEPYRPVGTASPCPKCGAQVYAGGSGQCWQCGEPGSH